MRKCWTSVRRLYLKGKLNELGVFDASVNEVRARAMYRVEVRRRMHDNVSNTRRNRFGFKEGNRPFDPNVYNRKAGGSFSALPVPSAPPLSSCLPERTSEGGYSSGYVWYTTGGNPMKLS